jgi:type II secretory pathway component PulC
MPSRDRGRSIAALLSLACVVIACSKKEVAAAKEKLREDAAAVTEVGRDGLAHAKDGIERVQTEVEELVEPEPELTDDKLVAEAKRAIRCKKTTCTMPRDLWDEMLERNELMAAQARTYRVQRGGETVGVELTKLGKIPKALGFRSGDVLVEANGVALDSVQGLAQVYVELKTAESVVIEYRRGKRVRTKTITFA